MNGDCDFSILVPTRNRVDFLAAALRSIREAFGPSTKVILGDNGNFDATAAFLQQNDFFDLEIEHFANPANSSYVFNLQAMVDRAATEWISILHDDDFFTARPAALPGLLARKEVDFIFSDHWISSNDGVLDVEETDRNSIKYGRSAMTAGRVDDLAVNAVCQSICLDGFFIRRDLASKVRFQISCAFGDVLWLIRVGALATHGEYLPDRMFAYRMSSVGLTATGFQQIDCLSALSDASPFVSSEKAKKALRQRIFRQIVHTTRYCVKRGRIDGVIPILKAFGRCIS